MSQASAASTQLPAVEDRPSHCPAHHRLAWLADGEYGNGGKFAVGACLDGGHPSNVWVLRFIGTRWHLRGVWDAAAVALAAPYR
jgi:hypothetical protein